MSKSLITQAAGKRRLQAFGLTEKAAEGAVNLSAIVKGIGEWRADKLAASKANAPPTKADFSWCVNGCDPKTGLKSIIRDGEPGQIRCKHQRKEEVSV